VILLPRTIRLDPSDGVVFAHAAEPGEWAVAGTFLFAGRRVAEMQRKEQIAFRSGFLGIGSFGFSTLVTVTQARPDERAAAVDALARQLVDRLGAPDMAAALPAAEEEIALAADLCRGHDIGTLVALHRTEEPGAEDAGAIRETFRTLKPRDATAFSAGYLRGHDRAFFIVETDDDTEADSATHGIDLAALGEREGE
jgi:hypothetical protein